MFRYASKKDWESIKAYKMSTKMETHTKRVRHHLRRPLADYEGKLEKTNTSYTLKRIVPKVDIEWNM